MLWFSVWLWVAEISFRWMIPWLRYCHCRVIVAGDRFGVLPDNHSCIGMIIVCDKLGYTAMPCSLVRGHAGAHMVVGDVKFDPNGLPDRASELVCEFPSSMQCEQIWANTLARVAKRL